MKPLIILFSGKAGHGKDSAAIMMRDRLLNRGYNVRILHYADTLKFIARTYYDWDGEKDENGRTLLQTLGTEYVRAKNPDFWICMLDQIIDMFFSDYDYILIPDARFPNEIEYWVERDQLADAIRVIRPKIDGQASLELNNEQKKHASETALDSYNFRTIITANNLTELAEEIDRIIKDYPEVSK